ncbi:TPA: hypothetical protein ACH6AG_000047 [Campylobacter jejuni]
MTIRDIIKLASDNLPQLSESEMSKKIEEIVNNNNLKSIQDAVFKTLEKDIEDNWKHVVGQEEIESAKDSAKRAGSYVWNIAGNLNKTSRYIDEQIKKMDSDLKKLKEEMIPGLDIPDSFLNKSNKDLKEYFSLFQDIAKGLNL